jgi:hypothetical protein
VPTLRWKHVGFETIAPFIGDRGNLETVRPRRIFTMHGANRLLQNSDITLARKFAEICQDGACSPEVAIFNTKDSDWRSKAHAAFAANRDVCICRAENPIVVNIDVNTIASWTSLPVAEAETKEWGVQSTTPVRAYMSQLF